MEFTAYDSFPCVALARAIVATAHYPSLARLKSNIMISSDQPLFLDLSGFRSPTLPITSFKRAKRILVNSNPFPGYNIMVPPVTLPASFLNTLRTLPNLPTQTWYYITVIALSVCNRPELIPSVVTHVFEYDTILGSTEAKYVADERKWLASEIRERRAVGRVDVEGRESALRILRKCREGLVKSAALGGLPKAINGLYALRKSHSPYLLDNIPDPSSPPLHHLSSTYPTVRPLSLHAFSALNPTVSTSSSWLPDHPSPVTLPYFSRGQTFFEKVYTSVSPRVLANMRLSSPDLEVLAKWLYALVLSEDTVLDAKETGYATVAALVPQDVNAQLVWHLKGCVNNGATEEEVEAVKQCVMRVCGEVGVRWKGEVAKL